MGGAVWLGIFLGDATVSLGLYIMRKGMVRNVLYSKLRVVREWGWQLLTVPRVLTYGTSAKAGYRSGRRWLVKL